MLVTKLEVAIVPALKGQQQTRFMGHLGPYSRRKPKPIIAGYFHVRKYWLGRAERQRVGFFRPREVWVWGNKSYPVASPEDLVTTIRIDASIGAHLNLVDGMIFQYIDPTSGSWVV